MIDIWHQPPAPPTSGVSTWSQISFDLENEVLRFFLCQSIAEKFVSPQVCPNSLDLDLQATSWFTCTNG